MFSERRYDIVVIGAGLLGCFAARNLRRWKVSVALIEAREDVCTGISRANTAIIYSGYDHKPGTLKAKMTVQANARMDQLCRELDVPFSRCGSLMVSYGEKADAILKQKLHSGFQNGVPGLRLLSGPEAEQMEPALAHGVRSALYAPTAGTLNPWALGIAAFENACQNNADAFFKTTVLDISAVCGDYCVKTDRGNFLCRAVVNCAGLASDRVQKLLFPSPVSLSFNAGDYLILDKTSRPMPRYILQYEPEEDDKGISVVPTVEGSLLVGPSERDGSPDYATDTEGLSFVRRQLRELLPDLRADSVIRSFAAARPNPQRPDGSSIGSFVIEHPAHAFWSLIGIKTPGLTCADELGLYLAEKIAAELDADENTAFVPRRNGIPGVRGLEFAQRKELVQKNADYGEILCPCEEVTKAEVLEAIRRGACTVDAVKRRVGTGMGRCQGARCQQKIIAILSQELGIPESAVTKDGKGTEILYHGAS